jgi:hypothetical protein
MSPEDFSLLSPQQQQQVLNGPSLSPPTVDILPNFDNPPNKNDVSFVVVTIGLAVSSIAILLRVYSMAFVVRRMTIQDCMPLVLS